MKHILRAISIFTALVVAVLGLASPASAVSFNNLDSSTAVAGASKALSDFYTTNPSAGKLLNSFFTDAEERRAENETETEPEDTPSSEVPGEDFGELVMYGYSKLGYVSAEAILNVRKKPTVTADAVDVLYRGEEIYVFGEQKTRTRVSGVFGPLSGSLAALSGKPFEGYEIHMGQTESAAPIVSITDSVTGHSRMDGSQSGNVYGAYVHGIFDGDAVAGTLVRALAARKGIDPETLGAVSGEAHKQRQYDLLADTIRNHMDMQKVYRILEEGV